MTDQQGDVAIRDTLEGGDLLIENGNAEMDGGLAGAVYLSLFTEGGWWGNKYHGHMLRAIADNPLTSAGRVAIERAAERDLAWLLADGVADTVAVQVQITGPKRVAVRVYVDGTSAGDWALNWGSNT